MAKFEVLIKQRATHHGVVEVEAGSPAEAKAKVRKMDQMELIDREAFDGSGIDFHGSHTAVAAKETI